MRDAPMCQKWTLLARSQSQKTPAHGSLRSPFAFSEVLTSFEPRYARTGI
ncbi:hypothetical protein [Haloarcula argentinensis]|uniref:Uncharacterized protein n=1 Tax=Haloarcula argentinensis TaxID=43776 RepID=A0ABU2F2N1_HALAR|nr:hypothetical protein [Haloarcula argentinensis]MDS0254819.1 hypothetical protein [Haloarcula argentinensis]